MVIPSNSSIVVGKTISVEAAIAHYIESSVDFLVPKVLTFVLVEVRQYLSTFSHFSVISLLKNFVFAE